MNTSEYLHLVGMCVETRWKIFLYSEYYNVVLTYSENNRFQCSCNKILKTVNKFALSFSNRNSHFLRFLSNVTFVNTIRLYNI